MDLERVDAPQPKRPLPWATATMLLAFVLALTVWASQAISVAAQGVTGGSATVAGTPAGWKGSWGGGTEGVPVEAPSAVAAKAAREKAAGIKVPVYRGAEPMTQVEGQTVVSITFDDGWAGARRGAEILDAAGLKGTFYVNSGTLDAPGYLSLVQAKEMAKAGHEIGGHTVSHARLSGLPADEAARQICQDRENLAGWGFSPTSFAYPFADTNASMEKAAKDCGYNSARNLGDVQNRFVCGNCGNAESLRPENPYELKAPSQVESDWTLKDLQEAVTAAGPDGGWVILTFHGICPLECKIIDVEESLFAEFTQWLAERTTTDNVVVRTVQQVIGGPNRPTVSGPAAKLNTIANPGLQKLGDSGIPACWNRAAYGSNTAAFSQVKGAGGNIRSKLVVSDYQDGDAKLLPVQDLGECAPAVKAGHSYSLRAWYSATADVQFAVYYRDGTGSWHYWASSGYLPRSSDLIPAAWTTPPLPEGATSLVFGLALLGNGELVTDDYGMYDTNEAQLLAVD